MSVSAKEFENLLAHGFIKSKHNDSLSLSKLFQEEKSKDNQYVLIFNADELLRQGAIEIENSADVIIDEIKLERNVLIGYHLLDFVTDTPKLNTLIATKNIGRYTLNKHK